MNTGKRRLRFPSLETMIKLILLTMGVVLTLSIIGMSLYRDYHENVDFAFAEMNRLETVMTGMSFGDEEAMSAFAARNLTFWDNESTPSNLADETRPQKIYKSLESAGGLKLTLRLDEDAIWEKLLDNNKTQLVMAFLVLIASVQVASLLAYSVTSPLRRLAWGFKQLSAEKSVRLPECYFAANELVMLTDAFNEMASKLDEWRGVQKRIIRMDRLAALGEMVSGVAHEIRNPLASMRIHLGLMYRGFEGDERQRRRVEVFEEELDRLERKLNLFLDFAKHRSNRRDRIEPGELVEWVANMVGQSAEEQGVRVEVILRNSDEPDDADKAGKADKTDETGRRGGIFFGDPDELRQALLNLALNGLQAIEQSGMSGGVLTIRAEYVADRIVLSVEDTGPGIPEEIGGRLFEPFVTSRSDGTGLGLAITRKCVEDHGGVLDYSTSPGGSRFFIVLPLYPSKEAFEDDHPLDS